MSPEQNREPSQILTVEPQEGTRHRITGRAPVKLPQELIDQTIDEISSNLDLKSSSLVSRAWTRRSQKNLFRCITLAPTDVELWLSRSEATAASISPWITEFHLSGYLDVSISGFPVPWEEPSILMRLIESLASSPIQHLRITRFNMVSFEETTMVRCFEPIVDSIRSLELRSLCTCTTALTFFISMFPNLDDLFLEGPPIFTTCTMRSNRGSYDPNHTPSFAGTFKYPAFIRGFLPTFLSRMVGFPLRFHTVCPGMLEKDDIPEFAELVKACAPTLREVRFLPFFRGT